MNLSLHMGPMFKRLYPHHLHHNKYFKGKNLFIFVKFKVFVDLCLSVFKVFVDFCLPVFNYVLLGAQHCCFVVLFVPIIFQ